jgi:uncharacterized membrane protein YkoI
MKKPIRFMAAGLLLAMVALTPTHSVTAGNKDKAEGEHDAVREALRRGDVLPLTKVLAIAVQRVPGDVIKVELEREKRVLIYEIKVLAKNGRVRELEIDARTGVVLKVEDD